MEELYHILSKHFSNSTTPEEEKRVLEFKTMHSEEYELLQLFWQKGTVDIQQFNTSEAWKKIEAKIKKPTKVVSFYRNLRKIAAVLIVIIMSTIALTYYTRLQQREVAYLNETDQPVEIQLADGSSVWLDRGALLTYPKAFKGNTRDVTVAGKAFFSIFRDTLHPFSVHTENAAVTVLGTSFNVKTNPLTTEVVVQSGLVEVATGDQQSKVRIGQGESALVQDQAAVKLSAPEQNYLSWKTGSFKFSNTPLVEAVADLNTYYGPQIRIDSLQTYPCNLSAEFNQLELSDVLLIISTSCDITIEKENDTYHLH